jgi:flagellin
MRINHNIAALNTYRQLNTASTAQSKSMEKLASGLRINKAGDDAAGLSISEKMRSQIRGLDQAAKNAQDGISMIQTAEGALSETHSILQRMRELGVQGGNDTNNDADRDAIVDELKQLRTEINRISDTTAFNDKKLLNGSLSTAVDATSGVKEGLTFDKAVISKLDISNAKAGETFDISYASNKITLTRQSDNAKQELTLGVPNDDTQTLNFAALGVSIELTGKSTDADTLGAALAAVDLKTATTNSAAEFLIGTRGGADETLSVSFRKMDDSSLGKQNGGSETLKIAVDRFASSTDYTKANFEKLVKTVDDSIKDVSKQRSVLGSAQNRLEHTINNLNTSGENLTAAESRIRDVDMAKEMMNQTKNSILSQAAQAMLAQANQQPQGVLQLLR